MRKPQPYNNLRLSLRTARPGSNYLLGSRSDYTRTEYRLGGPKVAPQTGAESIFAAVTALVLRGPLRREGEGEEVVTRTTTNADWKWP